MRKICTLLLTLMLAVFMCTAIVFAVDSDGASAGAYRHNSCMLRSTVCQFTDTDGNGFCDTCDSSRHSGAALCRFRQTGSIAPAQALCENYTDTNNDGICDNCPADSEASGLCENYTYTNNDGNCDNCLTDSDNSRCSYGNGNRNGRGCRWR